MGVIEFISDHMLGTAITLIVLFFIYKAFVEPAVVGENKKDVVEDAIH